MVRTYTLGLLVVIALVATVAPSQAQNRAWCTERSMSSWGFPNCAYDSFAQCRATASGTGAHCRPNPWLGRAEPREPRRKRIRR
jgi:hypothetical protein